MASNYIPVAPLVQGQVLSVDNPYHHKHHRVHLPRWFELRHLLGRGEYGDYGPVPRDESPEYSLEWVGRHRETNYIISGEYCDMTFYLTAVYNVLVRRSSERTQPS